MLKRFNIRILTAALVSMADEVLVFAVIITLLILLGVDIPLWAFITLALIFLMITIIMYRSLLKSPQLGFENMVSRHGYAVGPIARKGTVKINGELWSASTGEEQIESGTQIMVIDQTGLKLKVVKVAKVIE